MFCSVTVRHRTLNVVPHAAQQDRVVFPPRIYQFASANSSSRSSPPPSAPLGTPSLRSISVCLCLVNMLISGQVLDSTRSWCHMLLVSLLTTSYENLQLHPCCSKWLRKMKNHFFFVVAEWYSIVPTYAACLLYPLLCRWMFRRFPCLGYCGQRCSNFILNCQEAPQ